MSITTADRGEIQGVVTSGFTHLPHAGFVFLGITDAAAARRWLGSLAGELATSAPWERDEQGVAKRPPGSLSVAFTYPGLVALNLPTEALDVFPTEFVAGMASRASVLGDSGSSEPANWQFGGPTTPQIHAVLVVHEASEAALAARLEALTEALAGVVTVAVERGGRVERSREQFGFAGDGVSEPVIDGLHARGASPADPVVAAGEFLLGHLNALGAYPISPPVEVAHDPQSLLDPFPEGALVGYRDFGRNGTFLVYRKLSQDVAGFWSFMEAGVLAHDPSLSGDETALRAGMRALAAKFMGRWPSGAPVALSPGADDEALSTRNDFLYLPDGEGLGCPVGAHIRRANPRDSLRRIDDSPEVSLRSVSQHRILRRGIRYGPALFDAAEIENNSAPLGLHDDGEDRGLHFVALNADNQRQFEFVQQSWIDNPSFNGLYDNKDPVIGDNDATGSMTIPGSPLRRRVGGVPRFVAVRAGGYFFLPSVPAVRYLATLTSSGGRRSRAR